MISVHYVYSNKIKFVIIFLFISYISYSQINITPCTAERLCETKKLNNSYPEDGLSYFFNSSCSKTSFTRTVFYKLIIKSGSKFTFKIKPSKKADYDWAVWKNVDSCDNILNVIPDRFSANDGILSYPVYTSNWDTGLDVSKSPALVCQEIGSYNDGILSAIDVSAGDEILLVISLAQSDIGVSDYLLAFEGNEGGGGDASFVCIEEYNPYYICDVDNDNIEKDFNLNDVKENIVKEYLNGDTTYKFKFYSNEKDLVRDTNSINYLDITNNKNTVFCNIIKPDKEIYSRLSIRLNLVKYPVGTDVETIVCSDNVNLHEYDHLLSTTTDRTVYYYETLEKALEGGEALTMPVAVETITTYYALIKTNQGSCSIIQRLTVQPLAFSQVDSVIICSGENVTLTVKNSDLVVRWYNVPTGGSPVYTGTTFTLGVQTNQGNSTLVNKYYVEQEFEGCISERVLVTVSIKPALVLNLGEDQMTCKGTFVTLNAGSGWSTYLWSTKATTQTITVTESGTYSVTVTNEAGCKTTSSVVVNHYTPLIKDVIVNNNRAEVIAVGDYPLEYSLDSLNWQSSPYFYNLEFKIYNVYVRNTYGCITDPYPFSNFNIFNVLTPNGDGVNDMWNLKGLELYPESSIKIFDRYGKLIVNTKYGKGFVWDGRYLGRKVETGNYWYVIELTNGRKLTGWIVVKSYNKLDK